jgi:glycosyltransferase involved in cell wall biosynthesis
MPEKFRILCVHQGYELYGSDRIFLSSLMAFRSQFPEAEIVVILPRRGLLLTALEDQGFSVRISRLWVARKADGTLGILRKLFNFPAALVKAWKEIRCSSFCYINTAVVFDYAIAARFSRRLTMVHVHEIPTGVAKAAIGAVLRFSGGGAIFNSQATLKVFKKQPGRHDYVVLNGVAVRMGNYRQAPYQHELDKLRVLVIGRINNWKGQDLLLQAVARLAPAIQERLEICFAGASFENGPAERHLRKLVEQLALQERVRFEGFVSEPSFLYGWCDVVVVPSKKPEPFGLVAIEAMAYSRPVIAANHGGLTEIVRDGETGRLFPPRDADALSKLLSDAIDRPEEFTKLGSQGRLVYMDLFTEERYKREFSAVIASYAEKFSPKSGC